MKHYGKLNKPDTKEQTILCGSTLYEVTRIATMETENNSSGKGGIGTEFKLGMMKSSGNRQW